MYRMIDPIRQAAYILLGRLERNKLDGTMVYRMVAKEFDRDLYVGESRLHLALPKAEPLVLALKEAGRSRPKRREAIARIQLAKMRVR